MVYSAVGRIAEKAIRSSGLRLIERYTKLFTKYDKAVFRGLYGKSAGKGVRHGRDIGAAAGGLISFSSGGDDLDAGQGSSPQTSSKFKTRGGRGNFGRFSGRKCRPCDRGGRQSRSWNYNSGKRRFNY